MGTLDRWYVSGPIGVGTTFDDEPPNFSRDDHGSLFRLSGWEVLNLLDSRPQVAGQGPNLNLWAYRTIQEPGRAPEHQPVRLGYVTARFSTADAASPSYLSFHARPPDGDAREVMRLDADGNVNIYPREFGTLTVGSGRHGAIRVRNIDGKHYENDEPDGLFLNNNTGHTVHIGGGTTDGVNQIPANLNVHGALKVSGDAVVGAGGNQIPANLNVHGALKVSGDAVVGAGGNATLSTRHIDGKHGDRDEPEALLLNYFNGFPVFVGGGNGTRANLAVAGDLTVDTVRASGLEAAGNLISNGNVGIGTSSPQARLDIAMGDVRVNGRLFLPREDGSMPSAWPGGSAGGMLTWDLIAGGGVYVGRGSDVNEYAMKIYPDGHVWAKGTFHGNQRDLAEDFQCDDALEAGEVVSFRPERDEVGRSVIPDDPMVFGVVSTEPGIVLNSDFQASQSDSRAPIALCGRVPCKVVAENGPIRRGDLLTSSSEPGHAMRAEPILVGDERVYRSGTIIGKALAAHTAGRGTIDIFVNPS